MSTDTYIPTRVLAIYAHPDDPEVSCGGTLCTWQSAGSEISILVVSAGDKGTVHPSTDPKRLAATRLGEMEKSAEVMGASTQCWGLPDGEIENDNEMRRRIVEVIRSVKPDTVVAADPTAVFFGDHYINHRDHRMLGWTVLDAVSHMARLPNYFPDAGGPHNVKRLYLSGTLEPDTWIDITAELDRKSAALACHVSQIGDDAESVGVIVRQRAEEAGRRIGVDGAEGFRCIKLA